jgi:hypothetical protein
MFSTMEVSPTHTMKTFGVRYHAIVACSDAAGGHTYNSNHTMAVRAAAALGAFAGKRVLVTGGADGIGAGICIAFAKAGATGVRPGSGSVLHPPPRFKPPPSQHGVATCGAPFSPSSPPLY